MKRLLNWFAALSKTAKTVLLGLVGFLIIGGISQPPSTPVSNQTPSIPQVKAATTQRTPQAHVPVATHKTETEVQQIPFSTQTVQSNTLPKGTQAVTTLGINGSRTITYDVTYIDGAEANRVEASNVITEQPVTQVTTVGTYVEPPAPSCPNGTYVNSAGNTVCSPYASTQAPAGATAQCYDGTYSFSQSRSGTCSHHGGVAQWL